MRANDTTVADLMALIDRTRKALSEEENVPPQWIENCHVEVGPEGQITMRFREVDWEHGRTPSEVVSQAVKLDPFFEEITS